MCGHLMGGAAEWKEWEQKEGPLGLLLMDRFGDQWTVASNGEPMGGQMAK